MSDRILWEIIVVDNASTDNTKEVATNLWIEFGRHEVTLKVVFQPLPGLSFARKKGIESSAFDILVFCDDDNWLDENYLKTAYDIINSDLTIGALGGTGIAVAEIALPNWFEQYKRCYACYAQSRHEGELRNINSFLYGAGMVVKREVLEKLSTKKFVPILPDRVGDKLTSGGDTELSYAIRLIGYKLWFSDQLKFSHFLPNSRLTEQYLYRLISAMSYSSGLLVIYSYVLSGKPVSRFVWMKDATYQLFFFVRSLLRFPFNPKPSLERRLDFAFAYNRLLSVIHQAGSYKARYQRILRLTSISSRLGKG